MKRFGLAVFLAAAMVLAAPPAFAQPPRSLNKCQGAVAKEGGKYIRAVVDAAGKCLKKMSTEVIENGMTTAAAATAVAEDCVTALRKIVNTDDPSKQLADKFNAKVGKACDPAINPDLPHAEADTYTAGATTLSAASLGGFCQGFGGDGTIGDFDQWRDCMRTAAECDAHLAVATQWPRALEYLAALDAAINTLPASTKTADALVALMTIETAIEGATDDDVPEIACGMPVSGTCGDGVINAPGEQCDVADLGGESCAGLGFSGGTLACASCAFDTGGCTSCTGDAVAGDVLAGTSFSNAAMTGLTGTMPDNGAVVITPTVSDQAIAAGYHNGSGYCEGDAALVAGNIRGGQSIFGVPGDPSVVDTSSGDALAAEILAGKTCWVAGAEVTGAMVSVGQQIVTPTTSNQAISAGYHDGSGYCEGDTDLTPANIATGTTIFGVAGTALSAQLLKTGQTTSYGVGSDGHLEKGISRVFTDNGDGTITDERTGLMWEKKEDLGGAVTVCKNEAGSCANPHDADNLYEWCRDADDAGGCDNAGAPLDGPVVTVFLKQLNDRCSGNPALDCTANGDADCVGVGNGLCGFAGHRDWRLPNAFELGSIRNLEVILPAAYSAFHTGCSGACNVTDPNTCSCTASGMYSSSTTSQASLSTAFLVSFASGIEVTSTKHSYYNARAVRGG